MLSWCSIIAFVSEVQGKRTLNARGLHYIYNGRFGWQNRGWGKVGVSVSHWWARVLLATWAQWAPFWAQNRLWRRRRWHSFMSHTMGPALQPCPIRWHLLLPVIVRGQKELCLLCIHWALCVTISFFKKNEILFSHSFLYSSFQSEWTKVNVSIGSKIGKSNGELEMVGRKRRKRMEGTN